MASEKSLDAIGSSGVSAKSTNRCGCTGVRRANTACHNADEAVTPTWVWGTTTPFTLTSRARPLSVAGQSTQAG